MDHPQESAPGAALEDLGSAPVRTGHKGGMTSWITGTLVVPGVQGSWQPQA